MLPIIKKKTSIIEKPQSKGKTQPNINEQGENDIPRKVQDLEANSKILDFQNKIISSASIGPYPISKQSDPSVTMRSISQANDELDK